VPADKIKEVPAMIDSKIKNLNSMVLNNKKIITFLSEILVRS
jgi:hypothetical protein